VNETHAGEIVDQIATLLVEAFRRDWDPCDILATACTAATEQLRPGQALTDIRPGSWEAAGVDALTDPQARWRGPALTPLEVDCDCGAGPGQACWHRTHYYDLKRPHAERVERARLPSQPYPVA
jgi:hypothetical protein